MIQDSIEICENWKIFKNDVYLLYFKRIIYGINPHNVEKEKTQENTIPLQSKFTNCEKKLEVKANQKIWSLNKHFVIAV